MEKSQIEFCFELTMSYELICYELICYELLVSLLKEVRTQMLTHKDSDVWMDVDN